MTGIIILFGYVMSGAAVGRLLGDKGVWYSITLLASALMLTVLAQLLLAYFIHYDVRYILQWWYDISGFMVNRNAFALMAMLLLCFLLARQKKVKDWLRMAEFTAGWFGHGVRVNAIKGGDFIITINADMVLCDGHYQYR